jgi:SAM-dependent methyltransferase
LGCKSRIISWGHRARFRKAVELAGRHPAGRLLDYGCGDGTFLGLVHDQFRECIGADIAIDQVEDCRVRFRPVANAWFHTIPELAAPEHAHAYDVVTCMETLEHCLDPVVEVVLADLDRLCAPGGTVLISVPVEIGPTFLFKQVIRTVAGWRGIGEYWHYERYSVRDAVRMLFATEGMELPRPVYGEPGAQFHSHYGFNWRRLRRRVRQTFDLRRTLFSPLGFLGGLVSSQVWFVCRPNAGSDGTAGPG